MLASVRFVGFGPRVFFGNMLYVGFDPITMNLREQPGGSAEICMDRNRRSIAVPATYV